MQTKFFAIPALLMAALFSGSALAATPAEKSHDANAAKKQPDKANFTAPAETRTRDWAQMDTNRDHSISPEEMRKWMEANTDWGKARKN